MNKSRLKANVAAVVLMMTFSGCDEGFWGTDPGPSAQINDKTYAVEDESRGGHNDTESAGDPGNPVPYPEIIKRTYIPTYRLWAGTKCHAWRITWPDYNASVDTDKIAGVFTTSNGALNSFYYLNNVDPQNTYNTKFSLYHNEKVECTIGMWDELPYALDGGMETVYFAKTDQPLDIIQHWVEDRPSQFEAYWPGGFETELEYEQGDIILYYLVDSNRYGGIRIVSMSPRIIEVYFAVPNI